MKQIINDFINSIDTKLYSQIRSSEGDAECRRYLKEHLQEQLTIHSVSCRFIGGFQDTRTNKEDFALTPYLFGVWVTGEVIKVRGLGICWGYYSVFLGLGWNIPKNYPSFKVLSKNGS